MTQLLMALYFVAVIGVSIFLLMLAAQFVRAHERIARALERIADRPPEPRG